MVSEQQVVQVLATLTRQDCSPFATQGVAVEGACKAATCLRATRRAFGLTGCFCPQAGGTGCSCKQWPFLRAPVVSATTCNQLASLTAFSQGGRVGTTQALLS